MAGEVSIGRSWFALGHSSKTKLKLVLFNLCVLIVQVKGDRKEGSSYRLVAGGLCMQFAFTSCSSQ